MGTIHRLHGHDPPLNSPGRTSPGSAIRRRSSRRFEPKAPSLDYPIRSFIDDHRALVAVAGAYSDTLPTILTQIDGRMVVVVPEIRQKVGAEQQRALFRAKYGPQDADARLRRFRLVLKFLSAWNTEIS